MGRILVVLLGFGAISGAAWMFLKDKRAADPAADRIEVSEPKRRLDNVRSAAQRIEDDGNRRAAEAARPLPE